MSQSEKTSINQLQSTDGDVTDLLSRRRGDDFWRVFHHCIENEAVVPEPAFDPNIPHGHYAVIYDPFFKREKIIRISVVEEGGLKSTFMFEHSTDGFYSGSIPAEFRPRDIGSLEAFINGEYREFAARVLARWRDIEGDSVPPPGLLFVRAVYFAALRGKTDDFCINRAILDARDEDAKVVEETEEMYRIARSREGL